MIYDALHDWILINILTPVGILFTLNNLKMNISQLKRYGFYGKFFICKFMFYCIFYLQTVGVVSEKYEQYEIYLSPYRYNFVFYFPAAAREIRSISSWQPSW